MPFEGSGITPENLNKFSNADGFIVGSYLKENGLWSAEIDEKRVEKMANAVKKNLQADPTLGFVIRGS